MYSLLSAKRWDSSGKEYIIEEGFMKKVFVVLGASIGFIVILWMQPCAATDWTGNVNFTLGAKALDKDDWDPVEEHGEFGIHVDFRRHEWPVNLAMALVVSAGEDDIEGFSFEAITSEWRFGVKKIWEPTQVMRPFIGGGVALIGSELEADYYGVSVSDDDIGFGVWISGGLYWTLNECFNLGLELGYSTAEVTLFDVDVDAGGGHAGLILGYHW